MKRLIFLVAMATYSLSLAATPILPTPQSKQLLAGTFTLNSKTQIACEEGLQEAVSYLKEYLPLPSVSDNYSADNTLSLGLDSTLSAEAYCIRIRPSHIAIMGGSYGGVFNGIQSLLQLLPPTIYKNPLTLPFALPCLTIQDAPRFAYRGMMLDVARTWINAADLKRYINLFAYHKINKLHLHLTDDDGWRIEIKSHPELTTIGGFRGGDSPIQSVYGKWGEKYGGYYTQEEMRDIIRYAAVRNIEIIPEIDLPGHSRTIAHVYPEILCNYTPDTAASNGDDLRSAWCAAKKENYILLQAILEELCALFPSPYIHIGGDEVDMDQWQRCPDCKKLMQEEQMTSPAQLESYFMSKLSTILTANGKLPAVWNEAINGGLSHDSHVYAWENVKACLNSTSKKYETVVMPAAYFYFDMRQSKHEDGHDWASIIAPEKAYSFDFATCGFTPEQMKYVVGLEATFFSEAYVLHEPEKPDYLDYMLFPRVCILSELAWHGKSKTWNTFKQNLIDTHDDRMTAMGIRYRLFEPQVSYKEGLLSVTTSDGSQLTQEVFPDYTPQPYTGAIRTSKPQLYRFRSTRGTGRSPYVATAAYYQTITPTLSLTSSMDASTRAPFSRIEQYKSFAWTTRACRRGDWLLYTFASPVTCREIEIQTGNRQHPKCIFTTGTVEVSHDGQQFEKVGELTKGAYTLRPDRPIRAIRVVSTCDDNGCAFVTLQPLRIKR
ncbi:MAG: family 20 glycosylhydrolase [Alistipes sp.]